MIHTHVTVCIPLENREVCTRESVLCTEKYVKRRISKKKKKKKAFLAQFSRINESIK